ncbi:MAG TPA: HD domain-containing phosphohydrolase [Anaerolineales bacterium]|nr:HD domain-containing phosphohydrolase [Anaerolineales bacterium]
MSPLQPKRSHQIQISVAGALSIVAQGLLILPTNLKSCLPLPDWGSIVIGAALFTVATIWAVSAIRLPNAGWRGNAHLILNQAIIVIGIFLLLDSSGSLTRLGGFVLTSLITTLTIYGIIVNTSSFPLTSVVEVDAKEKETLRLLDLMKNADTLKEQAAIANQKLDAEKQRTTQLTYLIELSHQLNAEVDPPVAAQLAVNTLERAVKCTVVSLLMYEADKKDLIALASSGSMANIIPPGHRQDAGKGLHGRVARQKKTIIVNDTTLDADFTPINNENTHSMIIVPMMSHGQLMGMLEVRSDKTHTFNNMDVASVEGVASELTRAWERADYNQRLTRLTQSGISLTTLLDPQAAVQEIALLTRKTFEARFVFVTLLDQQGEYSRAAHAGDAPRLLNSLNKKPTDEPLLQAALNAAKPFRVRDLRKYTSQNNLDIDNSNLRSVLAIPIRLHRLNIGTILAFGKYEGMFFAESDESLADLLSTQAAASVESSWLYQELRNKENITSMLRQLSEDVIMTEDVSKAAETIARAAHKAANATETGIVIMTPQGEIQAEVELDTNGFHARRQHPMDRIRQAIQAGQSMFLTTEKGELACYPLLTRSRPIGALWMLIPEIRGQNFANIQLLANQAAVTLERVNLLTESRRQAKEIEAAYEELEKTYDQTLKALMSALDARDRETEGHSMRVSRLACLLGERLGLNNEQLKALERGALLHDIGKIGISDTILHKPGKLTDDEWRIMHLHPDIGARIVERIPFSQESMAVVRYHHERWNGSGYPLGIKGKDIPIHARIFAVVDVFDALTSNRSYRERSTPDEALQYLREHSEVLFDEEVVEALAQLPYADFTEGGRLA